MYIDWEDRLCIMDTLIYCRFYRDLVPWPYITAVVNAAIGTDYSSDDLHAVANRIITETHRFNELRGFTARTKEKLPAWITERATDDEKQHDRHPGRDGRHARRVLPAARLGSARAVGRSRGERRAAGGGSGPCVEARSPERLPDVAAQAAQRLEASRMAPTSTFTRATPCSSARRSLGPGPCRRARRLPGGEVGAPGEPLGQRDELALHAPAGPVQAPGRAARAARARRGRRAHDASRMRSMVRSWAQSTPGRAVEKTGEELPVIRRTAASQGRRSR